MPISRRSFCTLLALVPVAAACSRAPAPNSAGDLPASRRSDHLSHEELTAQQYSTVYDAIVALRPLWLNTRGRDSAMGTPATLQVHVNDVHAGSYEVLADMSVVGVDHIDFFDPSTAAARWGLGYNKGLIRVATKP